MNSSATLAAVLACLLAACASSSPEPQPIPLPPAPPNAIPAGSILMVRTDQAIDSRRQGTGHRFTCKLETDLVSADNTIVATRGTDVYAILTQANQSGNLFGRSELTIELTGIMIANQIKPISSTAVSAVSSQSSGGGTARSAATGALVGSAFRGSTGAKRGAAVGVGLSALSPGAGINIPPGTILQFQLANHLTR